MGRLVEDVYANALFEAALEEDKLPAILEEARTVREAIKQNPEILKMLQHPNIDTEDKLQTVDEIFGGRVDNILTGLIAEAVRKGHGASVKKILDTFVSLARKELKIGEAYVYTTFELDDARKNKIRDRIIETTGYKSMRIHYRVDETLIGGLVIKLGDRIVDSSIKTKLNNLTKSLM